MSGTFVHDANQTPLANAADISANGNGTGVDVGKPGDTRVKLVVAGAVTGTTPTLDIEIESSSTSDFSDDVVSHGRFKQLDDTDASSAATHYLPVYVVKQYMRYVATVGGTTPVFNDVTITLEDEHYHQSNDDSA